MAPKPKYDLKAADRKRNLAVQIGLTAIVVIFAVVLVLYIVMNKEDKPASGEAKSIRVTSAELIKKDGADEPKAVLSLYEDFLCPACGNFEKQFGPTVSKLIDSGAVAADYYMVSILDRQGDGYSTSRLQRRLLRGRGVDGCVPTVPRRAVRPAARGGCRAVPRQRPADRSRAPGRRHRRRAGLHQQGAALRRWLRDSPRRPT